MTDHTVEYCSENRWNTHIAQKNITTCLAIIQVLGWRLLTSFLNSGLGASGWCFPFTLSHSQSITIQAHTLRHFWLQLLQTLNAPPSHHFHSQNVGEIICHHYQLLPELLLKFFEPSHQTSLVTKAGQTSLLKLQKAVQRLEPHISSYWLHGSYGDNTHKACWSDVDGVAIVSANTFNDAHSLQTLRKALISSRRHMIDVFPYQIHGHFILTEPDLVSYPMGMFPSILFDHATCIVGSDKDVVLSERPDHSLAIDTLWHHGVNDLIVTANRKVMLTSLDKIIFLHRVYLLPCLVSQAYGKPLFKKNAFEQLDLFFLPNEIKLIEDLSTIWKQWAPPNMLTQMVAKLAWPLRFNPLIYQHATRKIITHLDWFQNAPMVDWQSSITEMGKIAQDVWRRLKKDAT